ncbi:MAG: hypothetical protein UZ22_OP11002000336 [Microgenomates bacterium OLB23]|nr:MAG: hypothetical protein UZ22_OP11002000336 [Microgenomates bacterium OLB23]
MLRREGWRLRQYELYRDKYAKEAENRGYSGEEKHDYVIKRLMVRGGPRLVKMYIDGNVEKMIEVDTDKSTEVKKIRKSIHKGEHVEHTEEATGREFPWQAKAMAEARAAKKQALERYYEKYIFEDLSRRFATSLIGFEQPRYMPSGEKTLYSVLNSFLEKEDSLVHLPPHVLQTEVIPYFYRCNTYN